MPEISGIIPAYQAESKIRDAVLSAIAQVDELIVVDDGSTDRTGEIAAACGARVLRSARLGPGGARNLGVKASRGELIAFLDADDRWLEFAITRKVQALTSTYTLVCSKTRFVDAQWRPLRRSPWGKAGSPSFADLFLEDTIAPSTALMRKSTFLSLGGFDETLPQAADHDFVLRLAHRYPGSILGLDCIDVESRRHHGQLTRNIPRMLAAWEEIVRKMNALAPKEVPHLLSKAEANMLRVASMAAYENGNSQEAAHYLLKALRSAPAWALQDIRTWKQLLAVTAFVLTGRKLS